MVRKLINYTMEGMESIWDMMENMILWLSLFRIIACFSGLAKFFVLFSTRVFSCGNSPLFLGGIIEEIWEEHFGNHFHYLELGQAVTYSHSVVPLRNCINFHSVGVGGLKPLFYELVSQGEDQSFSRKASRRSYNHLFVLLAICMQCFSHTTWFSHVSCNIPN